MFQNRENLENFSEDEKLYLMKQNFLPDFDLRKYTQNKNIFHEIRNIFWLRKIFLAMRKLFLLFRQVLSSSQMFPK